MNTSTSHAHPAFESLEPRLLLSGDLTVNAAGDDMLVVANANADAAQFNGGPGTDTINDDDLTINFNTSREIGFEFDV